jgi:predicted 3-demethylubiquinone-9 3-methyltransferase (glyoxalase superfamily)
MTSNKPILIGMHLQQTEEEKVCGWLKDKYGLSWQIVPKRLIQLMNDPNQEKAYKVVQAMMKMQKIIIQDLEDAYNS